MKKVSAVILAAGKGTRMNDGESSLIPKVMFPVNGVPMIRYSVDHVRNAGVLLIAVVVGYHKEMVEEYLGDEVIYAVQDEQLGTGHAVAQAKELLRGESDMVIVCYGDMPMFKTETIKRLLDAYEREQPTIAMLSVEFEDPEFWVYGRLIKDSSGNVINSVEQKDCSAEQLKIKECNPCFYVFDAPWLWENLDKLDTRNVQKEYYLTDMVRVAAGQGRKIISVPVSKESEALGINNPDQLKIVEDALGS
ncbi:MAG: NTP transferase domain-containing protein [Patescibacteria group bacterium]